MSERTYVLAAGRDFLDPKTTHVELTAEKIVAGLKKFNVIDLTQAEYSALGAREKAEWKKKSGFIIGGNFQGRKKATDCLYRSLVTLDLDSLTPESATTSIDTLRALNAHACIYSTASHRAEAPRLRVIVFLKEDISPSKYKNLVQFFANRLPSGAVSSESYVVSQIMYRPQRCKDGEEVFIELSGEPFDGLAVPDQTPDLPDRPSTSTKAWDVPGIVGKVARRYEGDFDRAIEELKLPYARSTAGATCGEFENRYTYTLGAGADGAVWYADDGHLWSHHGTDPCNGQNATIFDVVRLHNFHPEKDDVSLPISERQSHKQAEAYFHATFPDMAPAGATVDELDDVLDEPKVADPARFRVVRAEEFAEGPPLQWLIKGILPKAEVAVVYGQSGAGKSFAVYDMACAIERGVKWFGEKTYAARGVYVCAEAARGFRKRMKAYSQKHKVPMHNLPGVIGDAPNLMEAVDVQDLIAAVKAYGAVGWIVIDTLAAVMPGSNENESAAMTRLVANAKAIAAATGAIVILVHHSGKDAAKGARGHSSLRAASDVEIEVTRDGDLRVLSITKSKDDTDGKRFGFRLVVEVLDERDAEGDKISSCVIEQIDLPEATARKALKPELDWVNSIVDDERSEGRTEKDDVIKAVATAMPEKFMKYKGKSMKVLRGQAARWLDKLEELGVIFYAGDFITNTPATTASADEMEAF